MREDAEYILIAEKIRLGIQLKLMNPDGEIITQHPNKEYRTYTNVSGRRRSSLWIISHPVRSMREHIMLRYLRDMRTEFGHVTVSQGAVELIERSTGYTLEHDQSKGVVAK